MNRRDFITSTVGTMLIPETIKKSAKKVQSLIKETNTEIGINIHYCLTRNILLNYKDLYELNTFGEFWEIIGDVVIGEKGKPIHEYKRIRFETPPFLLPLPKELEERIALLMKELRELIKNNQSNFKSLDSIPLTLTLSEY